MIECPPSRMARKLRVRWVRPFTTDAVKKESLNFFLRPEIVGYLKEIVLRAAAVS